MCNISGYTGSKPGAIDKYRLLFLLGRDRGTDSCGICINGKRTLGYPGMQKGDLKLNLSDPKDFLKYFQFPVTYKNTNTVLMHSRKGTSCGRNADTAHPFKYDYPDGTSLYFMHNGTIHNEDDLALKYGISVKEYTTDTDLLGLLLFRFGMEEFQDVLATYYGAANLVWYYSNAPETIYIWKGASRDFYFDREKKKNVYFKWEDRPLFYWKSSHGLYFNSEEESLNIISNFGKVESFKTNRIFVINQGEVVKTIPVTRSVDKYSSSNDFGYFGGGSQVYTGFQNTGSRYSSSSNSSDERVHKYTNPHNDARGGIYWHIGLYYREGKKLSGAVYINGKGKVTNSYHSKTTKEVLYFYQGFWLKDYSAYEEAITTTSDPTKTLYHEESCHLRYGLFHDGEKVIDGSTSKIVSKRFMMFEYSLYRQKISNQRDKNDVKVVSIQQNLNDLLSIGFDEKDDVLKLSFYIGDEKQEHLSQDELLASCFVNYNLINKTNFTKISQVNHHYNTVNKADEAIILSADIETFAVYRYNYVHGTSCVSIKNMQESCMELYGEEVAIGEIY